MSDYSLDRQEDPFYYPGSIKLIYGAESPVKLAEIALHFAAAKRHQQPIQHLSFLGCHFYEGTRKTFRKLGRKLRRLKNMKELAINDVPDVGNNELVSLAPFLNANSTLRSLDLTGATFNAAAIREIRPFFRMNSSLEVLVLGNNQCVGDDGVKIIMSALRRKSRLRVLAFESCGMENNGVSSISNFMCLSGDHLRVLELSNNNIGDVGAQMLVDSLKRGHRLGNLGLNNAGIGDSGAISFGELLQSNRSLHTLSLKNNTGITDVGASSLLKALYDTESIKAIVESNHGVNLNLRGCSHIHPNLLHLTAQLCPLSRIRSNNEDIIRMKISKHTLNSECGMALEGFDLRLMPRLLVFIGTANGMTALFGTLKSAPLLCAQHRPAALQATPADEREEDQSNMPSSQLHHGSGPLHLAAQHHSEALRDTPVDERDDEQSNVPSSQLCHGPRPLHMDAQHHPDALQAITVDEREEEQYDMPPSQLYLEASSLQLTAHHRLDALRATPVNEREEEQSNMPSSQLYHGPDSLNLASYEDSLCSHLASPQTDPHRSHIYIPRQPIHPASHLASHIVNPPSMQHSIEYSTSVCIIGQQSQCINSQIRQPSFLETQGLFCILLCLALKRRSIRNKPAKERDCCDAEDIGLRIHNNTPSIKRSRSFKSRMF